MSEATTPQESAWNGDRACEIGIGILSTKLNDEDKEFKNKYDEINDAFDKLVVPNEEYGVEDADTPTNTALIVGGRTNSCYSTQFDSFCKKNEDMAYRKYLNKLRIILKNIECLMFQKEINKWEDAIITDGVTAESIRKDVEKKDRFR
jgi:hypothetical protein